jgi:hypothetical protein
MIDRRPADLVAWCRRAFARAVDRAWRDMIYGKGEPMAAVEHLAGRLVDGVQSCLRCDAILTDYRVAEVRLDAAKPAGWAEGARVVIEGRSMWIADGQPIGQGARACERKVRHG